jgi:hypothetical protein
MSATHPGAKAPGYFHRVRTGRTFPIELPTFKAEALRHPVWLKSGC